MLSKETLVKQFVTKNILFVRLETNVTRIIILKNKQKKLNSSKYFRKMNFRIFSSIVGFSIGREFDVIIDILYKTMDVIC